LSKRNAFKTIFCRADCLCNNTHNVRKGETSHKPRRVRVYFSICLRLLIRRNNLYGVLLGGRKLSGHSRDRGSAYMWGELPIKIDLKRYEMRFWNSLSCRQLWAVLSHHNALVPTLPFLRDEADMGGTYSTHREVRQF
jgi:hypothetical protein